MEPNSNEVTAATDTQDAIKDRYEVQTNIASEPVKSEPAKKVEPEPKPDSEQEPLEAPQESKTTINPRTQERKAKEARLFRENAELKAELAKSKQPDQPEGKKPRDLSKEPNILEYGDDALEYTRDVARYDRMQESLQEKRQSKIEAHKERVDVFIADNPDFDEKVSALVESGLVSPDIEDAVLSSPMSEKLSYHLANFNGDLLTLRGLPKELLPQAIKEIESFIKKGGNQEQEKPRVTQASPPIKPPGNSAKTDRSLSSYSQEEIENMPIAEFNKLSKRK
ncbi:MAG: hypothetical protein V4440_04720 [Pseudomonadota bacterium]